MKKYLAVFLAISSLLFMGVSCVSSDENETQLSPYAMLKSFSLGNIKSTYPDFTSAGEDTLVTKTIAANAYPFTINQATGEVFNQDSLPFCTDISKVVASMTVTGVASIFVDSTETYEHFSSSDSIDYTQPRKFRIYSEDATYWKDYTVRVNVHQVEPEQMVWSKFSLLEGMLPVRMLEFGSQMRIFGTAADGSLIVASASLDGEPQWYPLEVTGLADASAFATIQPFGDKLYAVSGGDLYCSENAADWNAVLQGYGLVAIIGASDDECKLWLASENEIFYTVDGVTIELDNVLPADFPLYGISVASYPLSHNKGIIRYMLVGYTTPEMDGKPCVWSRLSTESKWVEYNNVGNPYSCPSLKGLAVLRYDNFLYAFGGAGVIDGVDVKPFANFYISKDNGIVWKENTSFYQGLPKELSGSTTQFATTVDTQNYIWIACGDSAVVWKGIINRLGFKDK